jgi:hypothetical protein
MLTRRGVYRRTRTEAVSAATERLERDGYGLARGALSTRQTDQIPAEVDQLFVDQLFVELDTELRRTNDGNEYHYASLNRCARAQDLVRNLVIVDVIEPLFGEDCNVVANTAWRNPAERHVTLDGRWHREFGPHIALPADVPRQDTISYPVFVIAVHLLLALMPIGSSPTGVIPGNHRPGHAPLLGRRDDVTLTRDRQRAVPCITNTWDIQLFGSDIWHRRTPTLQADQGRDFLQIYYGQPDIAQRLRITEQAHQLSPQAAERAGESPHARAVLGLHEPLFYDGWS